MDKKIAVIGLGYVGLPLALILAAKHLVLGYDRSAQRVRELSAGFDTNGEATSEELTQADRLSFSSDEHDLTECSDFIIAVPTPVDEARNPDLGPLKRACKVVAKYLKKGSLVIFESTVYPGCTREVCIPILEEGSKLKCDTKHCNGEGHQFYVGYSPERINPGDKINRIETIVKVISGSSEVAVGLVRNVYGPVITAGLHEAESIEIAEASKIVENCQRDVNIAFMNEIAMLLSGLKIDTYKVLRAAKSKWNFIDFKPGLVGGHCISVDPYYLIGVANEKKLKAPLLTTARNINESIPDFIVDSISNEIIFGGRNPGELSLGILGLTFKEDCSDLRDSKSISLVKSCARRFKKVLIHDPYWIDSEIDNIGRTEGNFEGIKNCDILILAVKHSSYKASVIKVLIERSEMEMHTFVYDVKGMLQDENLCQYRVTLRSL